MSDVDKKNSLWDRGRRRWLGFLVATGSAAALGGTGRSAVAAEEDELPFPGEEAVHQLAYQFNRMESEYPSQVLGSVDAVLRKYGDDVKLVVVCFGPGIHLLARAPTRPVSNELRERVAALAEYGVEFHACESSLKSLGWSEDHLLPFAKVVDSGAADLMELQEQGYAYISW